MDCRNMQCRLWREFSGALEKENAEKIQILIDENPDFAHLPRVSDKLESLLLLRDCNKEISELALKFLESRADDDVKMKFRVAVLKGDLESAESLLKNGGVQQLSGKEWKGQSPALYVFHTKNKSTRSNMLKLLLKYGLDATVKNEKGENLLHILNRTLERDDRDAVEIAEALVDSGVSAKDLDENRSTTLLVDSYHTTQNVSLASFLISKGADVNKMSARYVNPLMITARTNDAELADLLISNGADLHIGDHQNRTPLHVACHHNKKDIVRLLLRKGAEISRLSEYADETPFSTAVKSGAKESMFIMVKEFSKLSFDCLPIHEHDMYLLQKSPRARIYFEKCTKELQEMAKTIFHGSYSYYSILRKSMRMKKLAYLTKNKEVVANFEANLCKFPYYKDDLKEVFEEAVKVENQLALVFSRLQGAFKNFFPDLVIKKLSEEVDVDDLPVQ